VPTTLLNVPHIYQRDRTDCLPLCVEMVLSFLGQPISRRRINQILEPTLIGTPGFRLLRLRNYGYDVTYAAAIDERPLTEALAAGLAPIALLLTRNLPHWKRETAHAVVIIGMDAHTVYLNDPAFPTAPQAVPRDCFLLAWSDFDMLYAVIRPISPSD